MSKVAAIILAAGQATRFRAADPAAVSKVVALLEGKPLVRHVAEAALASRASETLVITGHAGQAVKSALEDMPLRLAHNAAYAEGMATSLQAGIAALRPDTQAALILLADMPGISAELIDRLISAFERHPEADAVIPLHDGQRGNPVLLARSLFDRIATLSGDQGARRILGDASLHIVEIPAGAGATLDIDTPEALKQASQNRKV